MPSVPPLLLPTPDTTGLDQTKALFQRRTGQALSDEEAARLLQSVMHLLYLSLPDFAASRGDQNRASEQESPSTSTP